MEQERKYLFSLMQQRETKMIANQMAIKKPMTLQAD
jgi:hypothetical protein